MNNRELAVSVVFFIGTCGGLLVGVFGGYGFASRDKAAQVVVPVEPKMPVAPPESFVPVPTSDQQRLIDQYEEGYRRGSTLPQLHNFFEEDMARCVGLLDGGYRRPKNTARFVH